MCRYGMCAYSAEVYDVKIGDLVKHKWGTLAGAGIILSTPRGLMLEPRAYIMWNCHGSVTFQNIATKFLEVVSEVA